MPTGDLLPYIFGNTRLPLAVQFGHWVQESPRFRVFAETYRDKIRKKVRGISEAEGYRDLQAELAVAYFLLQERRFMVEYEKYAAGKQRGPDFTVTGQVTIGSNPPFTDTLLTAEVRDFGFSATSNTTDAEFEVKLVVTGGTLTNQPNGPVLVGQEFAVWVGPLVFGAAVGVEGGPSESRHF